MRLRFLGTGTSFGIPVVGCDCAACTSTDARDRRTRHAALLSGDDGARTLLVDAPPELRLQLVEARVRHLDAVWFTHCHADHIHGIDDLRVFSVRDDTLPAYAPEECAAVLRRRFAYIFDETYLPPAGTSKPEIELRELHAYRPVRIAGFDMLPLPVVHGDMTPFGFRVGDLGYVTDAKALPERTRAALDGVRVLVLNALWFGRPHPTHLNVEEAVALARDIGAERTYLTHLTHRVVHADLAERLPEGIEPAYDGLEVSV
ncbi:MAG TPA: MBL fold metallo-hydrolase [Longimicrobiales bacterium]|nr:MBL fold metallo-hydrolase [Longimicrobiales bacterium]